MSRTSTHAISVPITALIATAAAVTSKVNRSAATASGDETAVQNWDQPPPTAFQATAASGMSTTRLR